MNANERIRRLEKRVDEESAKGPQVDPGFVRWIETVSEADLNLLEAFVVKMGDEPEDPHRALWSQCSSYDDAMTMIRERAGGVDAI